MKTKFYISLTMFLYCTLSLACPVCEEREPALTRGLTHGATPDSNWDWVIVTVIAFLTLLSFFYSLKFLIKPSENQKNHIKNTILTFNND